jgi:predicted nuclease of predicted toxin-antitoxin system
VSKDTDFYQRSLLYGAPPKVIWLRAGNAPTKEIPTLLKGRYVVIRHFNDDPSAAFLKLGLP